jgi:hypothetical protein
MLGRSHDVGGRRIDDGDPPPGRGTDVDIVDANPGAPDYNQVATGREERVGYLDTAAHNEGLIIRKCRLQLIRW